MPADPKIASPTGQVTYDGTLNIDFKFDPNAGPNKIKLDANRLKEDAVDLDLSFQPRSEEKTMAVDLKATLAKQPPMTVKYSETRRSRTNFNGDLKYSFNANDNSAEKTYSCEIDRPSDDDVSYKCKGERTTLNLDIDRKAGKSKVYVDLNRFAGERIGYEASRNPQTNELDITLYTLVSSWNVKRQPGKSTTLVVKQKNSEVLRVEGTRVNEQEIQVKFLPSNVNLKYVVIPTALILILSLISSVSVLDSNGITPRSLPSSKPRLNNAICFRSPSIVNAFVTICLPCAIKIVHPTISTSQPRRRRNHWWRSPSIRTCFSLSRKLWINSDRTTVATVWTRSRSPSGYRSVMHPSPCTTPNTGRRTVTTVNYRRVTPSVW